MKSLSILLCLVSLAGFCLAAPPNKASGKVLLCYWGSWASYRWGVGLVDTTTIDPYACTHIIYAFAGLNRGTSQIRALDPWNDLGSDEPGGGKNNYRNLVDLQNRNPNLKLLLSIGGWNEGSTDYSTLARDPNRRRTFVSSVVSFLGRYGFHGLDFDWEWPGLRGGSSADKANYVQLLSELRSAFGSRYLLTVAGPALPSDVSAGFDLAAISRHVDYLSVLAYDYNVDFSRYDHGSPLYGKNSGAHSVDQTIQHYLSNGAEASKLLLGVTLYGRAFRVLDPGRTNIGDPANGAANAGEFSQQPGLLAWFELCPKVESSEFTIIRDSTYHTPYAYSSSEWIAYEDDASLSEKASYVSSHALGGMTAWSLENDDMHNVCPEGSLAASIKRSLGI